ncbi:MAG: hypothetical protein NTZ46_10575 [Verrucomicrobia bacterium]|nr:hypothetical protein [Verrucomicrobiota bacterium]
MQEGDKICIVRETGVDPLASENTMLVAALVTMGVAFYDAQPYLETREIVNGEERRTVTWCLATKTADGRFKTRELIQWWRDAAWLAANPEHPLAYAKKAVANYQRLVDGVKSTAPIGIIRKGGKFAMIPFDAAPERRQQLLDSLNP